MVTFWWIWSRSEAVSNCQSASWNWQITWGRESISTCCGDFKWLIQHNYSMPTVPRKGLWTLAIHCNNGEHRLVKGNRIHGESGVKICLSEDDILVNGFILRNPIAGHLSVAVDLREAKGEVDVVDVPDLLLAPGQRDEGNYLSHSCLHLVYHLAMAMTMAMAKAMISHSRWWRWRWSYSWRPPCRPGWESSPRHQGCHSARLGKHSLEWHPHLAGSATCNLCDINGKYMWHVWDSDMYGTWIWHISDMYLT